MDGTVQYPCRFCGEEFPSVEDCAGHVFQAHRHEGLNFTKSDKAKDPGIPEQVQVDNLDSDLLSSGVLVYDPWLEIFASLDVIRRLVVELVESVNLELNGGGFCPRPNNNDENNPVPNIEQGLSLAGSSNAVASGFSVAEKSNTGQDLGTAAPSQVSMSDGSLPLPRAEQENHDLSVGGSDTKPATNNEYENLYILMYAKCLQILTSVKATRSLVRELNVLPGSDEDNKRRRWELPPNINDDNNPATNIQAGLMSLLPESSHSRSNPQSNNDNDSPATRIEWGLRPHPHPHDDDTVQEQGKGKRPAKKAKN